MFKMRTDCILHNFSRCLLSAFSFIRFRLFYSLKSVCVCGYMYFISLYLHHSCNSSIFCRLSRSYSFVSRFQFEYVQTHTHTTQIHKAKRLGDGTTNDRWRFWTAKQNALHWRWMRWTKWVREQERIIQREDNMSLIIVRRFPTCGKNFPVHLTPSPNSLSMSRFNFAMSHSVAMPMLDTLCIWFNRLTITI